MYKNDNDGYSDEYGAGKIIEQSFAPNTPLDTERGVSVSFKVSKGERTVELPDFGTQTSWKAAVEVLTDMGFIVTYGEHQSDDKVDKDCIIGYAEYEIGDEVPRGTSIRILISSGPSDAKPATDN